MKFVSEFRDPAKARALVKDIARIADKLAPSEPVRLMEICGGHTHTIFRYGLHELMPPAVEFVHGPGCPVCVLPMGRVDECVRLARRDNVIFASFGDAIRVPGSQMSLLQARAAGADVRVVYSPMDALELARANPRREVVFFALGFETTMPSTALTIQRAAAEQIENFSVFCNHITIIATLRALLEAGDTRLDGFIGPGHVSMVIGASPYRFIAEEFGKPFVIAGFEPLDILQSVWMLLRQLHEGRCAVENQYARVVRSEGNQQALRAIEDVFELREFFEWRGLGSIDHSGVRLRASYGRFDAEQRYRLQPSHVADPSGCRCGAVLQGRLRPDQCGLFGRECSPETPLGALMVSSEGACAAYYQYAGVKACTN